jgi:large subunit ribosomal protein L15
MDNGVKVLGRGHHFFTSKIQISCSAATPEAIQRIEELGGSFRAEYYTAQGIRAITRPEATLKKFGRIPLRARPIDRKSIEFYRDSERRGYLVGAPGAPTIKKKYEKKVIERDVLADTVSELERAGDLSSAAAKAFSKNMPSPKHADAPLGGA